MGKRHNSLLIPYYFKDSELYVFLQRRTDDAPRNPGKLGGFGGGVDGEETYEQALLREMKEELEYIPQKFSLLGTFPTDHSISNYYAEEVNENFEDYISVHEGKWGEWHKATELITRNDVSTNGKKVVEFMINSFK